MTLQELIKELKPIPVIVRNDNHIQVQVGKKKYHNIWLKKDGQVKAMLLGELRSRKISIDTLKKQIRIKTDDFKRSEIVQLINQKIEGVFCDGSFKDGKGKIAIVRREGTSIDVHIREIPDCKSSEMAETIAINFAIGLYPNGPIYNDCESVVKMFQPTSNVHWISRENNVHADRFATCS